MSDLDANTQPDDDELDDDDLSGESSDDGDGQPEFTAEAFAALQQKVTDLEGTQTRTQRDVTAAIGRYQSLSAKVDAKPEDTGALKALQQQSGAVIEALKALLDDEAIDPAVKRKASDTLAKLPDAERTALENRIAELERGGRKPTAEPATGGTSLENELVDEITSYGLNPDDPAFDWKGEATSLLRAQGASAVKGYFRKQIKTLLEEQSAASRRQSRKKAGTTDGKTPSANNATKPLDATRPVEDRLKVLREMGVI